MNSIPGGTIFRAVYGANVLYPAPLRDLLIRLGMTDRVAACCAEAIHEEWISNLLNNRPDLTEEQLDRTRELMNKAIPGALEGYEHHAEGLTFPDPDDRHVLAAAIEAGADLIVTFNLDDFSAERLEPWETEAVHPDQFVTRVINQFPETVIRAVRRQRAPLQHPPKLVAEFLQTLRVCKLGETVVWLENRSEEI